MTTMPPLLDDHAVVRAATEQQHAGRELDDFNGGHRGRGIGGDLRGHLEYRRLVDAQVADGELVPGQAGDAPLDEHREPDSVEIAVLGVAEFDGRVAEHCGIHDGADAHHFVHQLSSPS